MHRAPKLIKSRRMEAIKMTDKFDNLLIIPPGLKIRRPLFLVDISRRSGDASRTVVHVSRMDGPSDLPAEEEMSNRGRGDWLTFDQTMAVIDATICGLPQRGQWQW